MKGTRHDLSRNTPKLPLGSERQWGEVGPSEFDSGEVSNTISRLQEQVISTAKDAYERIVDNASRTLSTMNRQGMATVREYPIQVSLGALAAGFLLGAAIFWPRRTGA